VTFVVYLEVGLFFGEGSDLKGKRKEVQSVKAQLTRRFGAAVAETDHHDLWQRATLSCALVARDAGGATHQADALERWLSGRFPEGYAVSRSLASGDELLGR
jgi:uncharacterized protein YlxP (DUF503 family)